MNLCLDDIREKIKNIPDKDISLDILDYLSNVEERKKELDKVVEDLNNDKMKLIEANNKLFARVTTVNETPQPVSDKVPLENILKGF